MFLRVRAAAATAASVLVSLATFSAPAHASILSLLPGSCGAQAESQVFAHWGDYSQYTPVTGGDFELNGFPWALNRAQVVSGNESFDVAGGAHSLALPAGSSATSSPQCASIYHPTVRFFARNTGSSGSRLEVQALYPGLLGSIRVATLGTITASSRWAPSPVMPLVVTDLLATVSFDQTAIAFRFIPVDSAGSWSVDDVYLDPYGKAR